MPKVVDGDVRRAEIADAVVRVLERDGVDAVSMRNVADELGSTTGLLTHWVENRSALLRVALTETVRRQVERAAAAVDGPHPSVTRALEQFLPLDDARRREMKTWLGFWALAANDRSLREVHMTWYRAFRSQLTEHLVANGMSTRDTATAVDRLMTTVDGIAVAAVFEPEYWTAARQRRVLRQTLDDLAIPTRPRSLRG